MERWQIDVMIFLGGVVVSSMGWIARELWAIRRTSDKEYFSVLRGAFDRPAFRGPYLWHSDHAEFQEAIASTIRAVKRGQREDGKDGFKVLGRFYGTFEVKDEKYRKIIQNVEDRLQRIFQLSKDFAATDDDVQRAKFVNIIDEDRDAIIKGLNEIWTSKELKLNEMRIPTTVDLFGEVYNPPNQDTMPSS